MKKIQRFCLLALIGLMVGSCEKSNPTPQKSPAPAPVILPAGCFEGVVIGGIAQAFYLLM